MDQVKIGFIGFGEAAFLIAEGLLIEGVDQVYTYDAFVLDTSLGPIIKDRAQKIQAKIVPSLEQLCQECSIIFNATSAKVAEEIANTASEYLTASHLYIDLNATSPMVKQSIAATLEKRQTQFVDAAIMDPVPLKKHKVPMFLSGTGAKSFEQFANQYGMNVTYINSEPGSSSAIKMLRSIFMKGFSMLLLETVQASKEYDVIDTVLESLNHTITSRSLEESANLLLNRTAIHAKRRVSEMDEVVETLRHIDIDATMSLATQEKLNMLVDLDISNKLNHTVPEHYSQFLNVLK